MSKHALYYMSPYIMAEPLPFKKLSLLFEKIYIKDKILSPEALKYNKDEYFESHGEFWQKVFTNLKEVEYLKEKNILSIYESDYTYGIDESEKRELTEIFENVSPDYKRAMKDGFSNISSHSFTDKIFAESTSISARIDALMLANRHAIECFPIVFSTNLDQQVGKKENVFRFLLNDIPEPDDSTSWEQIIDFRSDEDTRLKYLALINWVNEVAKSNLSVSELKDKYEYLYLEYKRSYERHKIKSTFSTLEIIAATGVAFLTSNLPVALNLVSNFFKIGTSTMGLLKEEGNLPGKEIAYIYHANREFGDS
jgi:hypothetical protein